MCGPLSVALITAGFKVRNESRRLPNAIMTPNMPKIMQHCTAKLILLVNSP